MFIRRREDWELSESEVTDEAVYRSRREIIKAGLVAASSLGIAGSLSPRLLAFGMRAAATETLSERMPVLFNTVVSNVPGPRCEVYLGGARVYSMFGLGPVMDQVGLFHAVMSIGSSISIAFASCREMLPDPQFYRQCLRESFEALRDATTRGSR